MFVPRALIYVAETQLAFQSTRTAFLEAETQYTPFSPQGLLNL